MEIKLKQLKKFKHLSKRFKQKFEYVVSTDSKKILKILKNYSWIKSFKRKEFCLLTTLRKIDQTRSRDL